MSIVKYDNLLLFVANDIIFSYLVEILMKKCEFKNYDMILFKTKNFGKKAKKQ